VSTTEKVTRPGEDSAFMTHQKRIPTHFLIILTGCAGVLMMCMMPVTAAICDGPPNSQSFILFTGGCDRSPHVLPCTQGFIFPALPSPGGDFPTQYYLDFGDGSSPYYGPVDGVTHTYTSPGQFTLNYKAGTQCDLWRQGTYVLSIQSPENYTHVISSCVPAHPVAGFTATPVSGFAPLTVRFTSTSIGADAWAWKFGDGGTSPAENPSHTYTTPGTYSVSLAARDSCTGIVNQADKLSFVTVTATAGTLAISSTPPGAIVFIDNVVKGITPVTLTDTAAGSHTLLLTRTGYEDYTRIFTIESSGPATIGATLARSTPVPTTLPYSSYGSIAVTSIPPGATIILDDQLRGTAPAVIQDVLPGNHVITLTLHGYNDWSQVIPAGSGHIAAVNAFLVVSGENPAGSGSLAVTSDPPGADIYIDGGFKGVSPVTISGLSAGNHAISVKLQGYEDNTTSITITAGQTGRFMAALQKVHTLSVTDILLAAGALLMIVLIGVAVMLRKDTKK
jgi:PKD repeat protein